MESVKRWLKRHLLWVAGGSAALAASSLVLASTTRNVPGDQITRSNGAVIALPTTSQTLCGKDENCTLTTKTMSGASNTFTNIPNSATTATAANTASAIMARDGSGQVAATTFTGALVGNADTATTATNASHGTTASTSSNASFFPLFVPSSSNGNQVFNLGTGLSFNPSTNALTTTTFVGALTGTASGNLQATATNHGVLVSGSGNTASVTSAGTSGQPLLSGGASADPAYGTVGLGGGGTGATTKAAAFDALSPMSASGDIIYGGTSGTGTRLAKGADGTTLQLVSGIPSWQPNTSTPAATSWDGYDGSNCSWSTTSTSLALPAVDTSCTLTEVKNNNMGTVNPHNDGTGGHNYPGIVINPASTGTYFIAVDIIMAQSTSGSFAVAGLTADGGSTFIDSKGYRGAATNGSMSVALSGLVTVSGSTTIDVYISASANTTTIDQENAQESHIIKWSLFRVY